MTQSRGGYDRKERLNSRFILKVESTEFPDGLDIRHEKTNKKGFKVLGPEQV